MMTDQNEFPRGDAERAWVASLARASAPPPGAEDRAVAALRREGLLGRRRVVAPMLLGIAAALLVFASGAWVGAHVARGGSVEGQLYRDDASLSQRVLVLQRAGSAYIRAMQRVAAVAPPDSIAAEVATQALTGAALAAARAHLDSDLSPRLVSFFEAARRGAATSSSTLIWY